MYTYEDEMMEAGKGESYCASLDLEIKLTKLSLFHIIWKRNPTSILLKELKIIEHKEKRN